VSDRCFFKFKEIDVDTQVKKETHIMQKYANSLISLDEARIELGLDPEVDEDNLFPSVQGRVQIDIAQAQAKIAAKAQPAGAVDVKKDGDKQASAPKGQRNLPSNRKGTGNAVRPANQNGRNTSPNIRRSDMSWLTAIENALEKDYNVVYTNEKQDPIENLIKDENTNEFND
jgi:hypothetical protein